MGNDEEELRKIRGARVLLAEDNEINQQVAKEILEQAGVVVSIANNGQEALDLVWADTFDALLMDVQMPVMDGYTATRKIRELEAKRPPTSNLQPPTRRLPIIAMTAHAMSGDHEKSIAAGMNDHITKPIDPAQLFGTLAKWIGPRPGTHKPVEAPSPPTDSPDKEPAPPEKTMPDAMPEFDLTDGLQRLMGNRALYRKLLVELLDPVRPSRRGHSQGAGCRRLRPGPRAGARHQGGRRQPGGQGPAAAVGGVGKTRQARRPRQPAAGR